MDEPGTLIYRPPPEDVNNEEYLADIAQSVQAAFAVGGMLRITGLPEEYTPAYGEYSGRTQPAGPSPPDGQSISVSDSFQRQMQTPAIPPEELAVNQAIELDSSALEAPRQKRSRPKY